MKIRYYTKLILALSILQAGWVRLYAQDTLHVQFDHRDYKKHFKKSEQKETYSCIVFEGMDGGVNWNRIFNSISTWTTLKEIQFIHTDFEKLPEGLGQIKQLQSLIVIGNEELEMESCLGTLSQLPSLKKMTWELYDTADIPLDIINVHSIDSLIIIDHELSDMRLFYPSVLHDKDVVRMSDNLPLPSRSPRQTALATIFITKKKEIIQPTPSASTDDAENEINQFVFQPCKQIESSNTQFERKYESVDPPLENEEVDKEYYVMDVANPNVITTERSGTEIIIPPSSFVDQNGKTISGEVIVDFREYRDVADFIISGIPMSFQTDEEVSLFRSAGMFEINASQNGEEVFLAKDKNIYLNFQSTDSLSDYQFYSFNDSASKWLEIGNARPGKIEIQQERTSNDKNEDMSDAVEYYIAYKDLNLGRRQFDTTSFQDRYNSLKYYGTNKYYDSTSSWLSTERSYFNPRINLEKIKRRRNSGIIFDLRTNYPEIKRMHVQHWMMLTNEPYRHFKKYNRKRTYHDIRLIETSEGLTMQLKEKSGFKTYLVQPVKQMKSKHKTIYEEQPIKLTNYNKGLSRREKLFNRGVQRDHKKFVAQSKTAARKYPHRHWMRTRKLMTKDERKMKHVEWELYCDSIKTSEFAKLSDKPLTLDNFYRTLSISGFGIFNVDQIKRLENQVEVLAEYRDEKGKEVKGECVYVVDSSINGVMAYSGNRGYGPNRFTLDPATVTAVLLLDDQQKIRALSLEPLDPSSTEKKQKCTFEINSASITNSGEALRSALVNGQQ
jgi:hypothetical protein